MERAALSHGGAAVDSDVLGESALRRTRYHRELLAPMGIEHTLFAYLRVRGRIIGALVLGRTGAFSEGDLAGVRGLLSGLSLARMSYGVLPAREIVQPLDVGKARARPSLVERLGIRGARTLASAVGVSGDEIRVRDHKGFREMVAKSGPSELVWSRACVEDPSESGWPYVELLHLAAVLAKARRRALFIGCGGAVAVRQFALVYPGMLLDIVECEPKVVELAREYYALDAIPGVTVHIANGADFVAAASGEQWDVIVVDAFDAVGVDEGISRRDFTSALNRVLCPGGALAFNVFGALKGRGPLQKLLRALSEFDDIRVVPVMTPNEAFDASVLRNVVIVARKHGRA